MRVAMQAARRLVVFMKRARRPVASTARPLAAQRLGERAVRGLAQLDGGAFARRPVGRNGSPSEPRMRPRALSRDAMSTRSAARPAKNRLGAAAGSGPRRASSPNRAGRSSESPLDCGFGSEQNLRRGVFCDVSACCRSIYRERASCRRFAPRSGAVFRKVASEIVEAS